MSFGPLKRLPSGAPADSTVRVPSFSSRITVRSLSAHQISRPCESKLAQLGPIKSTCERPLRVCAPVLLTSLPV